MYWFQITWNATFSISIQILKNIKVFKSVYNFGHHCRTSSTIFVSVWVSVRMDWDSCVALSSSRIDSKYFLFSWVSYFIIFWRVLVNCNYFLGFRFCIDFKSRLWARIKKNLILVGTSSLVQEPGITFGTFYKSCCVYLLISLKIFCCGKVLWL